MQYSCKAHILALSKQISPLFPELNVGYNIYFGMLDLSSGSPRTLKGGSIDICLTHQLELSWFGKKKNLLFHWSQHNKYQQNLEIDGDKQVFEHAAHLVE